jgi:hypothetical protein
MENKSEPKVEVVFNAQGVEVVRLYGSSWLDSSAAAKLFDKINPYIRAIHSALCGENPEFGANRLN